MLAGETILSGADPYCCGVELPSLDLPSPDDWFIRTHCASCDAETRESSYFVEEDAAEEILAVWIREQTEYDSWQEANEALVMPFPRR